MVAFRDLVRSTMLFISVWNLALLSVIIRRWFLTVPKDGRRLLFHHVILVSLSTVMFLIGGDAETIERIGRPFQWRGTPLTLAANILLFFSLVQMIRWLRTRAATSSGGFVPSDKHPPGRRWTDERKHPKTHRK